MSAHTLWKLLLYTFMAGYIIFIAVSVYQINQSVTYIHRSPEMIMRETREIKTRLLEMRNILPGLLSTPDLSYDKVLRELEMYESAQDKSLERVRKIYSGDQARLTTLRDDMTDLRKARRQLAARLAGNTDYERATSLYAEIVQPSVTRTYDAANAIFEEVEGESLRVRVAIRRRMELTILLSVILGALITTALILTDRREKAKNRELAFRDGLFNQLSRNVDEVFIVAVSAERFEFVSSTSYRIINIPAAEIISCPRVLLDRLPLDDRNWLENILDRKVELLQPEERETSFGLKDRFYRLRVYPVSLSQGRIDRFIISVSDQTDIMQRHQALSDALKNAHSASNAKSAFLSHMSHEIRTPMNAIIGMTTIAISRIDDRDRVQDCLGKISEASRHLLGLINDVLDMSRIENGKMAINSEPFNLKRAVENLRTIIQPQCRDHGLDFEILLENTQEEELIGDALRLNQVLLNILSNAVKFTPAGGSVRLTIRQLSAKLNNVRLRFSIADTGIGMSEEFLKRVYQPFEQASANTTAKYGGSGLGMAITNNLVALMGGSISAKSVEGKGSTFTVELPFGISGRKLEGRDSLPPLKVLIVDDDRGTCEHAHLLLEKMGLNASWTLTGSEAVELAREAHESGNSFDVCFVDWKMPDMDGAETARRLRDAVGDDMLIIIISAYDWTPIEEQARAAGVNDFIAKPFFSSTIYNALITATERLGLAAQKNNEDGGESYDFTGRHIMLVEDNEFNREIAQEFLEMVHAEVENAENGQIAVEKFKADPEKYDIILMDIQMPVLDGYGATSAIRSSGHPRSALVPILAMTANAFSEDIAKSVAAGMDGHLAKPIDVKELYRLIDLHLKKQRECV